MRARHIRHGAGNQSQVARRGRRPATRRRPIAAAVAAVVVGLAGCADLNEPEGVAPGGSDPAPAPTTDAGETVDTGAPLLQISHGGGFVLIGTDFASVPQLTVYPDGQAITHGPQILVFPGPLLPNLITHDLDDAQVEALVAAAQEAGLLDASPAGYGQPPVADAPTTFVTLRVDGTTYRHSAEALGVTDPPERQPGTVVGEGEGEGAGEAAGEPLPENPPPGPDLGLSPEEIEARQALSDFIQQAHELVGAAGEGESYDIDAFAIMARPAPEPAASGEAEVPPAPVDGGTEGAGGSGSAEGAEGAAGTSPAIDSGLEPDVVPWPLTVPLVEAADCLLVDGEEAGALHDVLVDANAMTHFEQAGVVYQVWFRPLLPHEDSCDDVVD